MGLFGGSASSSGIVTSSINFNPAIQFGTDNAAQPKQTASFTPSLTQTTKDTGASLSAAASAGLALAPNSSASGGTATLAQNPAQDAQATMATATKTPIHLDPKILGIGAVALGGFMLIKNKKKAK